MNRVDVNMYDGGVEFESDDYEVTRALTFYLKAKGVAEVATSLGWTIWIIGFLYGGVKILKLMAELAMK